MRMVNGACVLCSACSHVSNNRLEEEIARHRHHPLLRLLGMGAIAAMAYVVLRAVWPIVQERMERRRTPGLAFHQGHVYQPPMGSHELLD